MNVSASGRCPRDSSASPSARTAALAHRWEAGDASAALDYAWALKADADADLPEAAIGTMALAVSVASQACDGPLGDAPLRRDVPMLLADLAFRRRGLDDLAGARDAAGEAWERWVLHAAMDQDDDWLWVASRMADLYSRTLVSAGENRKGWEVSRECLDWTTARRTLNDAETDAQAALMDGIAEIEFGWRDGRAEDGR